jgi:hypothetical protein
MTPVPGTSFDLEQARLQIRTHAAHKRLQTASNDLSSPHPSAGCTFSWLELRSSLKNSAHLPPLDALPAVDRYHGVKRRLALLLARGVLFFSRFLLDRQASWNRQLVGALLEMGKALHNAEVRAAQQEERIRRLEARLSERMKDEG